MIPVEPEPPSFGSELQTTSDPNYSDYNLPPPLEMALRRFGKWSDEQLLRE